MRPFIFLCAASGIALFGGRLILAHNRILYPYHKWFMRALTDAPGKPPGFLMLLDTFLKKPATAACDEFCNSIIDFMNLQQHEPGFISRFVMDTEWNWRYGRGPVEDW
ncbi:MAG: hypothetical protein PHW60_00275 [Kiritimatiellae bacterium]|nr:hypothetical protein [Kiritimatiellia bacterium]